MRTAGGAFSRILDFYPERARGLSAAAPLVGGRGQPQIRDRPEGDELVRVDDRTDRLHGPVRDVQREYADHPAVGVEREPARLAVHPRRPQLGMELDAAAEQPGDEPGDP